MHAKHTEMHSKRNDKSITLNSDESPITIEDQSKKSTIEAALNQSSPIHEDDAYSYVNTTRQQPIKFDFDSRDDKKNKNDRYEETGDFKLQ